MIGSWSVFMRVPSEMFAFQYGHCRTCESNCIGSPAMKLFDARLGSIIAACCLAYSFDNRPAAGTFTNAGSA